MPTQWAGAFLCPARVDGELLYGSVNQFHFTGRFVSAPQTPLVAISADREVCNRKPLIFLGQDISVTPAILPNGQSGYEDTKRTLKRREWLAIPSREVGVLVHDVYREQD